MIKRIFYYAIFLVGFLFIAGTKVAQAVSLPDFSKTSDLPAFISSVYSFALTVVGIAVFIRILYAGFLMLTAAGNSSKWGDARTKMQNAVIGAILLFAAYMILFVINPDLVKNTFNFSIPSAGQPSGVGASSVRTDSTLGPLQIVGTPTSGGTTLETGGLRVARADEGIYPVEFTVTDANGDSCTQVFNIEVVQTITEPGAMAPTADTVGLASIKGRVAQASSDCVNVRFSTTFLPTAFVGVPYSAEVEAVEGETPYIYSVGEPGSSSLLKKGPALFRVASGAELPALLPRTSALPPGLNIVATMEMPILSIENKTQKRDPSDVFFQTDTFELKVTNAKPNSKFYMKWLKNGEPWFYPNKDHDPDGWTEYGVTDSGGVWVNSAKFTPEQRGNWQEQVFVNGKVSNVIAFQVVDPATRVIAVTPNDVRAAAAAAGVKKCTYTDKSGCDFTNVSWSGGGVSVSSCTMDNFCENIVTLERTEVRTQAEKNADTSETSSNMCRPGERVVNGLICPSGSGSTMSARTLAEWRRCNEQLQSIQTSSGYNTTGLPHSSTGPTGVSQRSTETGTGARGSQPVTGGYLWTSDQYSGGQNLGGNNFLIFCYYSDFVNAVAGGAPMTGQYCTPAGVNNTDWCIVPGTGGVVTSNPAPTFSSPPTVSPSGRGTGGGRAR